MVSTSAIIKVFITPSHVVAATQAGTILLLDVNCAHQDLENDPHKRLIEAGQMWDIDWHGSLLATGNDDGTAKLWSIETG